MLTQCLRDAQERRTFQTDNVPVSHLAGCLEDKDGFFSVKTWGIGQQKIQGLQEQHNKMV
jgi:hypothetical protein